MKEKLRKVLEDLYLKGYDGDWDRADVMEALAEILKIVEDEKNISYNKGFLDGYDEGVFDNR